MQTARSLCPASHPASRPRTGASLPGIQASPRTGLTPAGRPELVAPLRHVDHPFFTAPEQSRRTTYHAPLHQLTDTTGPRVRVRTPEPEALADAIRATTSRVIAHDGEELLVAGAGQEAIGRLAFERGVVLYGLAAETDSLEDIFLNLTNTNHAEEAHR